MSKEKWVATGVFSFILFFLIRDGFLAACGLDIVGNLRANFFLACTVFGFVALGVKLIPEKYMRIGSLIPSICLLTLLAIGFSSCITSCNERREKKNAKIRGEYFKAVTESLPDEAKKEIIQELFRPQNQGAIVRIEPAKPQEKSSPEKPGKIVKILSPGKKISTKSNWGQTIGTSTFPEAVNSWSRFAQTEAQKAMQRAANL